MKVQRTAAECLFLLTHFPQLGLIRLIYNKKYFSTLKLKKTLPN